MIGVVCDSEMMWYSWYVNGATPLHSAGSKEAPGGARGLASYRRDRLDRVPKETNGVLVGVPPIEIADDNGWFVMVLSGNVEYRM